MYIALFLAAENAEECSVSQAATCVFPENGKDSLSGQPLQFLTDDVIMTSTVDAVDLKNMAPHDVRYTIYGSCLTCM